MFYGDRYDPNMANDVEMEMEMLAFKIILDTIFINLINTKSI